MSTSHWSARLTEKQRRFCEEFMVDGNGSQAAVRAGYSPKGAKERAAVLLKDEVVQGYLEELRSRLTAAHNVTTDYVMVGLKREAEDADNQGSTRVAALAHIGKILGMFTEKVESKVEMTEIEQIQVVLVSPRSEGETAH